jgi:hypothetical protein
MEVNSTGGLTATLAGATFALGVAPLPCTVVCAAPVGGAALAIVAADPQRERDGASEVIEVATTIKNNVFIVAPMGYLPMIEGAIDDPPAHEVIAANLGYLMANPQLEVAFTPARPPTIPAIRFAEPAMWQSIVLGERTAADALTGFGQTMCELIATN